ncbi:hypothetical protein BN946_scf185011.g29 [Trametes cinnabarina]|uniref:Uncharacterized protein n=1 Tax=Pycnoporus cinnabarinus TaxID=5643 RepID=A0A060SPT5_PYCCI|nr:hypothetical protein BN946_scf185011.g29 [Trametes cinnabarina]
MHHFRTLLIVAVAFLAFMVTQASAFGVLPLTRYMLDKVPDGSEDPTVESAATMPDSADINPSIGKSASSSVDASPVLDPPEPVETPVDSDGSSVGDEAVSSQDEDVTLQPLASAVSLNEPSFVPVYAKINAAGSATGGGSSVLLAGSIIGSILFVL